MQEMIDGAPAAARLRSADQAHALVVSLVSAHADSLLRVSRRHSLCADDAQDAYQRGLEILLRHADRLDPARAAGWLHTVVKHEAMAVRASRQRILGGGELDFDALESRTTPSPEEQVIAFERVGRAAEALQRLKPHEVQAMWLKAAGGSYAEICEATGWSYTKVNRCLAEGRKSFLERFAGIDSGEECERWAASLSAIVDGEASAEQVMAARPHLRNCAACRATIRELREARPVLAAVFPAGGLLLAEAPAHATGHLARLAEVLFSGIHDRVAGLFVRAQAIADATTVGKATAVVASAAAIAGGGVAVRDATTEPPPATAALEQPAEDPSPPKAEEIAQPAAPAPTPAAAPDTSTPPPATPASTEPQPKPNDSAPAAKPAATGDELGLESAAPAAAPAPTSASTAPAPRAQPPVATAAPKPSAQPATKATRSEFTLEGP